jgi:hypothetical protein
MRGFLEGLIPWLQTHEFVAIWLEGIALLAIFIWDRIDSHQNHKETLAQIDVSQRQFESSVRPVLIPHVAHRLTPQGDYRVELIITNRGNNEAVISSVELDFYCRRSENCQHQPTPFPFLDARLLTPGETVVESTTLDPKKEIDYHEEHDGECNWIFRVAVRCSDVLSLRTHTYRFDEILGIHHYIDPVFRKVGPVTARLRLLANTFRNYRYRLRIWVKSRLARLGKSGTDGT